MKQYNFFYLFIRNLFLLICCTGIAKGTTRANIEEDRLPNKVIEYNKTKKESKKPFKSLKDFTGINFPIDNKQFSFKYYLFSKSIKETEERDRGILFYICMLRFLKTTSWFKQFMQSEIARFFDRISFSDRCKIQAEVRDRIMHLGKIKRIIASRTSQELEVLKKKRKQNEVVDKIKHFDEIKHIIESRTSQKLEVLKKKQTFNEITDEIKCFDEIEHIIEFRILQELEKNKKIKKRIEEELSKQIVKGIDEMIHMKAPIIFEGIKEKVQEIINDVLFKKYECSDHYKSIKKGIKNIYATYLPKTKQILLTFLCKNLDACMVFHKEGLMFKQICRSFSKNKVSSRGARGLYAVISDMGQRKVDLDISYPENTKHLLSLTKKIFQFPNPEGRLYQNIDISITAIKILSAIKESLHNPLGPSRVFVCEGIKKFSVFKEISNFYEITKCYDLSSDRNVVYSEAGNPITKLSYYKGALKLKDLLIDNKIKPDYQVAIVRRPAQDRICNFNFFDYCKNNKKIYHPSLNKICKFILFFASSSAIKKFPFLFIQMIGRFLYPKTMQLKDKKELVTLTHWDEIVKRITPKSEEYRPYDYSGNLVKMICPRKIISYGGGEEAYPIKTGVAMRIAQAMRKKIVGDFSENKLVMNRKKYWWICIDPSLNFITRKKPIGIPSKTNEENNQISYWWSTDQCIKPLNEKAAIFLKKISTKHFYKSSTSTPTLWGNKNCLFYFIKKQKNINEPFFLLNNESSFLNRYYIVDI